MLAVLLALAIAPGAVSRDSYGVPKIVASSAEAGFELLGATTAEDRLWQLETSRRSARGSLAEILGPSAVAGDKSTLRRAYTEEELQAQLAKLDPRVRGAFEAYARGVNSTIQKRSSEGTLPVGYAKAGIEPAPWTATDSAAIAISLARRFGTGGAGELRNLALLGYLRGQKVKGQVLDAFDDLAWQNDPRATSTLDAADEPKLAHPTIFPSFDRQTTERQLAELPEASIFELLPAIQLAADSKGKLLAQRVGAPWKTGSYAVAVSAERSATGHALLLSGPQMGHSSPSVVYEAALVTPELKVCGITVPGIPLFVVGFTPDLAWGLTSGVADLEDVFASQAEGEGYAYGGQVRSFEQVKFERKVLGGEPFEGVQKRTHVGPVVLETKGGGVFSVRSSFWGRELEAFGKLFAGYGAKSVAELQQATRDIPVTFNLFMADRRGEIGWSYTGLVPLRAEGLDPRLPTPLTPQNEWKGFVPSEQMPRVASPQSGLLANWNNKPASWWPNGDTPVWGRYFRNEELLRALDKKKLTRYDLEMAAWTIARRNVDDGPFWALARDAARHEALSASEREALRVLDAYDGWNVANSPGALLAGQITKELRQELFSGALGSFMNESFFERILQPTLIMNALEGATKVDYLAGRESRQLLVGAFQAAVAKLAEAEPEPTAWRFRPAMIRFGPDFEIPYSNRGTFIQVVELGPEVVGSSVAGPGAWESGEHKFDQAALLQAWLLKPMHRLSAAETGESAGKKHPSPPER